MHDAASQFPAQASAPQPAMHTAKVLSLTEHRGNRRLWMEGNAPRKSGFEPGLRFSIRPHGRGIVLTVDPDGDRTVSRKVRAGKEVPVMDINSDHDLAALQGVGSVRVVFGPNAVYVTPLASEIRRQRRLIRARDRLSNGLPLTGVGVAAGGGVLSHAIHSGFAQAGVPLHLVAHNEVRDELAEHAQSANDCLQPSTVLLTMPLQELAFDDEVMRRLPEVDVVELGLPCSGASVAGRAKRGLGMPEEHPDVGHLVVGALALLARLNPVVAIFENVPQYATSASACLIRQQLRDMGYDTHEREALATEFGDLEARRRWSLVAVTRGIAFDLAALQPEPFAVRTLADVIEPHPAVADRYCAMQYLKDKQVRDIAAGKGFRMQIYRGDEPAVNTITKGYAKVRSTDPKLAHPTDPDLLRQFTAREHARVKGVPESLVAGLPETTAHELLGQGICAGYFRQLGAYVARSLKTWARQDAGDLRAPVATQMTLRVAA